MITTLADAKTYMKIGSDTTDDSFITSLIVASQDEIEAYCGQKFEQSARTYIFNGTGSSEWLIGTLPIAVSPAAALSYRETPFTSWVTVSTTLFTILRQYGVNYLYYDGTLTVGTQNYKLAVTVGYASNALPADIVLCCKEMVFARYRESANGAAMLAKTSVSRTTDGYTSTESYEDLRPKWKRRLSAYKRITL